MLVYLQRSSISERSERGEGQRGQQPQQSPPHPPDRSWSAAKVSRCSAAPSFYPLSSALLCFWKWTQNFPATVEKPSVISVMRQEINNWNWKSMVVYVTWYSQTWLVCVCWWEIWGFLTLTGSHPFLRWRFKQGFLAFQQWGILIKGLCFWLTLSLGCVQIWLTIWISFIPKCSEEWLALCKRNQIQK